MKVLVVAEEKMISRPIQMSLLGEGFAIDAVYSEAEALLKAPQGYNLILLDKYDCLTMIRGLRQNQISTPILCLSAKDKVEDIVAGLNAGSDGYLTKPFVFIELAARMRALIRRGNSGRGAALVYADLRLEPASHKVWRNGIQIPLSTKEYGVLECFMRNPGQILSRKRIGEISWTEKFDFCSNLIDVYVSFLRKKIDQGSGMELIHTVRGAGYMLKAG